MLVENEANLHAKSNSNKLSIYLMAAAGGHVEILKYLESLYINPSDRDKHDNDAYTFAKRRGNLDAMRHITERRNDKYDYDIKIINTSNKHN